MILETQTDESGKLSRITVREGPTLVIIERRGKSVRTDIHTGERYLFAIEPTSMHGALIVTSPPVEQEAKS